MTTLVSPQGALGEHSFRMQLGQSDIPFQYLFSDISKWTRTIAFLVALVVVSCVVKLVKGIKVNHRFDSEAGTER